MYHNQQFSQYLERTKLMNPHFHISSTSHLLISVSWAGEESNLWSRKTADLQSAPFGHSGTCPFTESWIRHCESNFHNPSHLSESNQRPTDYKSVALPAELKWHSIKSTSFSCCGGYSNKELPPFFGKAKVKEFDKYKNFNPFFFPCFQCVVNKLWGADDISTHFDARFGGNYYKIAQQNLPAMPHWQLP